MTKVYVIDPLHEVPDLRCLGSEVCVQQYAPGDTFESFWSRCRSEMSSADVCVATVAMPGAAKFQIGWMAGRGGLIVVLNDPEMSAVSKAAWESLHVLGVRIVYSANDIVHEITQFLKGSR